MIRSLARGIFEKIIKVNEKIYSGNRRQLISLILVLFSIYIIGHIFFINREFLLTYNWDLKYQWVATAVVVFIIDFLLSLYGWHLLVYKFAGVNRFVNTSRLYLISNLARRLPGSVWYIADRAMLYKELGLAPRVTISITGLEIVMFIISGFLTFLLTVPIWLDLFLSEVNSNFVWISLFAVLIGGIILTNPKVLFKIWTKVSAETLNHPLKYIDTVQLLVIYVGTWVLGGGVIYALIASLYPLELFHIATVIGVWALSGSIAILGISALPIFSVRDISMILFLSQIIPSPIALLVAILARVLWAIGELGASVIALRMSGAEIQEKFLN